MNRIIPIVLACLSFFLPNQQTILGADAGQRVDRALKHPIKMSFDENTLETVLIYWSAVTNVKVSVDWQTLKAVGVTKQTLMNVNISSTPAGDALRQTLAQLNTKQNMLDFKIVGGVVHIATKDALKQLKSSIPDQKPKIAIGRTPRKIKSLFGSLKADGFNW